MEKIDFIKWWSESSLSVRYNALLSVGVLGLVYIIYYQHNQRKNDAEIYRNNIEQLSRNHNSDRIRFDSIVSVARMEVKECEEQRYKDAQQYGETFRNLYQEKEKVKNYEVSY
jgi:hypothetical protein